MISADERTTCEESDGTLSLQVLFLCAQFFLKMLKNKGLTLVRVRENLYLCTAKVRGNRSYTAVMP